MTHRPHGLGLRGPPRARREGLDVAPGPAPAGPGPRSYTSSMPWFFSGTDRMRLPVAA